MRSLYFSLCTPDQTPTPTRFLKNCEEVGLFNELDSSFEQEFPKAQEDEDKRAKNPVSNGTGWRDSVIQSDVHQTWGAACCQKLKIYGLQSSLSVLMCNTASSRSLLLCLSCSSVFLFFSMQLPAPNSRALDMSLQTPSDIKVKEEDLVEVDSSPPASPDSISSMSDSSKEPVSREKGHALCKPDC